MDKEKSQALLDVVKTLFNQAKYEDCINLIKPALMTEGVSLLLLNYLGASYASIGKNDLALAAFSQYLHYRPNDAEVLANLGAVLQEMHYHYLAEQMLINAFSINPEHPMLNRNLGIHYYETAQMEKALYYYQRAIKLDNSDHNHLSYAHALLCNNNFVDGWQKYEYRISMLSYNQPIQFKATPWHGENLDNKTLCIYTEQGIGDCIQFIRFLPLLKKRYNLNIIMACSPVLIRLFECIPDIDGFFYELNTLPAHDYYTLLCSLPLHLQIHHPNQLMPEPYLEIHPAVNLQWQQNFPPTNKIKIGICWSGNSAFPKNQRRSCQLSDFLFLRRYPQIELFSIQKEISAEDGELLAIAGIPNLGQQFKDFADTGAVIKQMDLIISVDTSVTHLAGALGAPTWVLLSYYNEWRYPSWLESSIWYNDMKFIRQTQPEDWRSVFTKVDEMIKAFIVSHQLK
jgi:tetratricopeptide (TPR) repeat protein